MHFVQNSTARYTFADSSFPRDSGRPRSVIESSHPLLELRSSHYRVWLLTPRYKSKSLPAVPPERELRATVTHKLWVTSLYLLTTPILEPSFSSSQVINLKMPSPWAGPELRSHETSLGTSKTAQ
jgi:hypothetical protein